MLIADDGKSLQVVSFNRSPASYGEGEWEIRGVPVPKLDANGDPILDEKGKQVLITDKTRQRDHWLRQRAKK